MLDTREVGIDLDANGPNTAISTISGRLFDMHDPETWVYEPNEIAYALSKITRYGGHSGFYSVAEHSIRVLDEAVKIAEERGFADDHCPALMFLALNHDATEAYVGDIPRPQKHLLRVTLSDMSTVSFEEFESRVFEHMMEDVTPDLVPHIRGEAWDIVKAADHAVYKVEAYVERPNIGRPMYPAHAEQCWRATNRLSLHTLENQYNLSFPSSWFSY